MDWIIAVLDPSTGERRILLRQADGPTGDELRLVLGLSTDESIAVATGGQNSGGIVRSGDLISLLDVETKTLRRDLFEIDTPWLCFPEFCLRD